MQDPHLTRSQEVMKERKMKTSIIFSVDQTYNIAWKLKDQSGLPMYGGQRINYYIRYELKIPAESS